MIYSLNPANGKLLRRFDAITPELLESKLEIAATAAKLYPGEPLDARRFWMRRLAVLLESDREELAATMVQEMGKTIRAARAEVDKCASVCRYYADTGAHMLEPENIDTEHEQSYVRWDPLGVILAVMPWNFPLWQVFRFLAPALMAGNVGLLKHAPNVPQCALAIEALVRRAGFPRGSLQTLLLEDHTVAAVLADERVAAVTLTGSEVAGRAVAGQAGHLLKKSVLELGGSDAFVVMPSANVRAAVDHGVAARCLNNGQSCIAAKRFLVHEAVYEEFEQDFVERIEALRIGDPMDENTDLGPLAKREAVETLLRQMALALAAGGQLLTGGKPLPGEGFFVEPTVIAGVPREAEVCREETFGPLALLFRVRSIEEAIALANDTPYGLGASCWTTVAAEQQQLAAELQAGSVFFNTPVASDPRLPFGGIKRSGYGRELSAAGMREFLNAKTVVVSVAKELPRPVEAPAPARAAVPAEPVLVLAAAASAPAEIMPASAALAEMPPVRKGAPHPFVTYMEEEQSAEPAPVESGRH